MNERRWNLTLACLTMGVGCVLAGLYGASYWALLGLSLMTIGLYAGNAHLFPLPSVFLTGPALATGRSEPVPGADCGRHQVLGAVVSGVVA